MTVGLLFTRRHPQVKLDLYHISTHDQKMSSTPHTLRRRYSAPTPSPPLPFESFKDSPLPKVLPLDELMPKGEIEGGREEAIQSAFARVFAIPELLTAILENLRPRECVGVQRVSTAFYDSVAAKSKTEKKVIYHLRSEYQNGFGQRFPWERYDEAVPEQAEASHDVDNVAWNEILGDAWVPDTSDWAPDHKCTVVVGHTFGSFFIYMHANFLDPFAELFSLNRSSVMEFAKALPIHTCVLYLHYDIEGNGDWDWNEDKETLDEYYTIRTSVEVDPDVPEHWISAAEIIAACGPKLYEVRRFAENIDTSHKSLRQQKSSLGGIAQHCLYEDPVFHYYRQE